MKRSEMVKIIGRELRAQSSGNCDIDPNLLLYALEAAGMLPPFIDDFIGQGLDLIGHNWELEDE